MRSAFCVLFTFFCLGNVAWGEVVDSDRTDAFEVSDPTTYTVNDGGNYTFSGVISGTGAITKDGVGALKFSGDNTATGALTVNGGTLTLANYTMFSSLIVNDGVANLTINYSSPRATFPQPSTIVVGSAAGTAAKLNLNAQYSLNQTAAFTLYKNAEVTMNNVNNFAWTSNFPMTFVGGGTVSGTGVWQQGALVNALVTGTNAVATVSVRELNIYGNMKVDVQDASSVMNVSSSVTHGTGYSLTKNGAGRLVMTGSTTLGNTVQVNAGTLAISGNAWNTVASFTVTDGATLELGTGSGTNKPITLSGAGAGGAGALNFVGNATVSGGVTLSAASTISTGTGTTGTIQGSINGNFVLAKTGAGRLILDSNTIAPDLSVQGGTLNLAAGNALYTGKITIANGATLEVGAANFASTITSMTGIGNDGDGVLRFTADNTCSADINVVGASRVTIDSGKTVTFSGILSGNGPFAPKIGTAILTGANTHTGSLDINNDGTLILGDGTVNPTVNASSMNDNAHLIWDVAPETSVTFNNAINGSGTFVKRGTGTLVLGGNIAPKLEVQAGTFSLKDGTLSKGLTTAAGTTFSLDGTIQANSTLAGTWVADEGDTLQMTAGELKFDNAIGLSLPTDNLYFGEKISLFSLEGTATTNAADIDWMAALVTPEMQSHWIVGYDPTARMFYANVNGAAVPEPSALCLLLLGMAFVIRKRVVSWRAVRAETCHVEV